MVKDGELAMGVTVGVDAVIGDTLLSLRLTMVTFYLDPAVLNSMLTYYAGSVCGSSSS